MTDCNELVTSYSVVSFKGIKKFRLSRYKHWFSDTRYLSCGGDGADVPKYFFAGIFFITGDTSTALASAAKTEIFFSFLKKVTTLTKFVMILSFSK